MEGLDPIRFLYFAIVAAPGFVASGIYRLIVPSSRRDPTSFAVEIATYGMINLALISWMVPFVFDPRLMSAHPAVFAGGVVLMLIVMPCLLGVATFWIRSSKLATRWLQHPMPTSWDFLFSQRRFLWVLFHLKNGRRVGGYFGRESFASSHPLDPDVYVENVWRVDEHGRFVERVEGNAGLIVRFADCDLMEFYRAEDE